MLKEIILGVWLFIILLQLEVRIDPNKERQQMAGFGVDLYLGMKSESGVLVCG